jgi:hypothetical protein
MKLCALLLLATVFCFSPAWASDETAEVRQVENFSKFEAGTFPEGWKCLWSQEKESREIYSVRMDETAYLEARAVNSDVAIAKAFEYDLKEYPFLSWQWRTLELPAGADERYKETGDSAAGMYVIFPGKIRPYIIKYVWSTTLPTGTLTTSPFNDRTKIVVLRNHTTPIGTWVSEKVNVYEDYKKLIGQEPEPVRGIGIMSDSNNTRSRAEAHYRAVSIAKE